MQLLEIVGQARQKYFETGETQLLPVVPEGIEESQDYWRGAYEYFIKDQSNCPNWNNNINVISFAKMASFSSLPLLRYLSPTKILIIAGSESPLLEGSKLAYDKSKEPKEILQIKGSNHHNLFNKDEYVNQEVDRLVDFFKESLILGGLKFYE